MIRLDEIRALAAQAGFDLAGLARVSPLPGDFVHQWISEGRAADMDWYVKRVDDRLDVTRLLPNAQSVLALACNYYVEDAATEGSPIARYARGRDYHATLRDRLRTMRRLLRDQYPGVQLYQSIDHGPVMEKVWAVRAGLGFVGKNGCLITPELGSYVVLSVFIVDAPADVYTDTPVADVCGKCRLCIDACPTDAITPERQVDARRCISYVTIEQEGPVSEPLRGALDGWVFGCDVCQTVCPLNEHPVAALGSRFEPRAVAQLDLLAFASLTPEQYAQLVPGTALARAQYGGLRRNAVYGLGALRDDRARPVLERLSADPDPTVRDAAQWALSRLDATP